MKQVTIKYKHYIIKIFSIKGYKDITMIYDRNYSRNIYLHSKFSDGREFIYDYTNKRDGGHIYARDYDGKLVELLNNEFVEVV